MASHHGRHLGGACCNCSCGLGVHRWVRQASIPQIQDCQPCGRGRHRCTIDTVRVGWSFWGDERACGKHRSQTDARAFHAGCTERRSETSLTPRFESHTSRASVQRHSYAHPDVGKKRRRQGEPAAHTRATDGFTTNARLDQAARGHAGRLTRADYQVIEYAHANQLQRVAQLVGDVAVRGRWFGHT